MVGCVFYYPRVCPCLKVYSFIKASERDGTFDTWVIKLQTPEQCARRVGDLQKKERCKAVAALIRQLEVEFEEEGPNRRAPLKGLGSGAWQQKGSPLQQHCL